MLHHLSPQQLLFLCSWRPPEGAAEGLEGRTWRCPTCEEPRTLRRVLVRLEAPPERLLVQCARCDCLAVLHLPTAAAPGLETEYAGPHVDAFSAYLTDEGRPSWW